MTSAALASSAWCVKPRKPAEINESPRFRDLSLPDKPSIAVLPFANLSSDPEQEYFADGMVEEIITALSRTLSMGTTRPR